MNLQPYSEQPSGVATKRGIIRRISAVIIFQGFVREKSGFWIVLRWVICPRRRYREALFILYLFSIEIQEGVQFFTSIILLSTSYFYPYILLPA